MSSVRKHFSLEAANFSLFSREGEVTSSLIPGPAWSLRLQFTKYQQRYAPMKFFFFCNFTYSLYPEHWIIQEPVFVLHLFTCHGRIMPRLAELLLASEKVKVLNHPPYSPDLSPCDFFLFPRLKKMLSGNKYMSRSSLGSAIYQCLQQTPKKTIYLLFVTG